MNFSLQHPTKEKRKEKEQWKRKAGGGGEGRGVRGGGSMAMHTYNPEQWVAETGR